VSPAPATRKPGVRLCSRSSEKDGVATSFSSAAPLPALLDTSAREHTSVHRLAAAATRRRTSRWRAVPVPSPQFRPCPAMPQLACVFRNLVHLTGTSRGSPENMGFESITTQVTSR
jgi:hypothetical protein